MLFRSGHRDDALDILRFLKENQLGDPDQIQKLEEELDYGFLEKVRSLAWNGILKGEVYDTYSGIGAVSADLTMFGDLRDLVIQTWKRIRGDPDADNWVMGLSLAGVSSSTFPFVNGSYALAKSLAKYSQKLSSLSHNSVLKKFLSGKLSADDAKKIWDIYDEAEGSIPRTASALSRITKAEDLETVMGLIKVHKKTGSAFILLAGEKGIDLYRATPKKLKSGFIEIFRKNPRAIVGLTKAHLIIHSIKVLHKYHLIAVIIPILVASLILNLFPWYVVWACFIGSMGYLFYLATKRPKTIR